MKKETRGNGLELILGFSTEQECLFHWGLAQTPNGPWQAPPEEIRPPKTRPHDGHAVQTSFSPEGLIRIHMDEVKYVELPFVLYFPQSGEWDNNDGRNYRILLAVNRGPVIYPDRSGTDAASENRSPSLQIQDEDLQRVSAEIIRRETGRDSWTLMHRYNLCHDLVDRIKASREGLALLFVWLRFSALRQLDWQRNYNTKPGELGHAQQRLTSRLARLYEEEPSQRELVRLLLTTIGHGGQGQRIRDEILEIMHRHGIKEVSEEFMEQWHQKMHNNTTPDDIVICEAYLAFLRSDGDQEVFRSALEAGGVSRARIEGFERPILARPDFYPDKKEPMIRDFEHFLGTLKSVHSATDLGISIQAARDDFDEAMHRSADYLWEHRDAVGPAVILLFRKALEIRRRIGNRFQSGIVRPNLLRLDVALEDFLRTAVERNMGPEVEEEILPEWFSLVAEGFLQGRPEQDLSLALLQWNRIRGSAPIDQQEFALLAESVLDRMERTAGDVAKTLRDLLQPKAEFLGKAFHAEPWVARLFSEEVVRGGLIFALSILCRRLRLLFRKRAKLSPWQLISRGRGKGRVEVMESLDGVQGRRFDPPVLIVSRNLRGNEDLPEGVLAVLTPDSVDVVSHVAIRARDQGILLATCHDEELLAGIESSQGRFLSISSNGSGEVRVDPAEQYERGPDAGLRPALPLRKVSLEYAEISYALTEDEFEEDLVGGKSLHLKHLRKKLPEWVHVPGSVGLPFGTFGKVIRDEINRKQGGLYFHLSARIDEDPNLLPELRSAVMGLAMPEYFPGLLREAMQRAGLSLPDDMARTWECIKGVWASKWNDRAYWNRRARKIPHDDLLMAVLVQEVVPAEYAYIIHTAHPLSGNRDEIYAELVLGLGETLAGNYPGRAMGFSCQKTGGKISLLSYPSKSVGLYGRGLILRSDSNGEDLAGLAGAGLYDSFQLDPPQVAHLNYAEERIVREKTFRNEILQKICEVGIVVEEAMGSPQDIEGVYAKGRYYVVQTRPQVGLDDE